MMNIPAEIITVVISSVALIIVGYLQYRQPRKKSDDGHISVSLLKTLQDPVNTAHSEREEAYNELSRAIAEYILSGSDDTSFIEQKLDNCKVHDKEYDIATKKFLKNMSSRLYDEHKE